MRQFSHTLTIDTGGPGLYEITAPVVNWCGNQEIVDGLLTLFIQHTSASLTIQENADPDVCRDLLDFFNRIAPQGGSYLHSAEGPDDMPAHIKSALTQTQLTIPFLNNHLALGTWQGIYVFEHRNHTHRRRVMMHLMGDRAAETFA
jgi:secondary thiamine-phosphate synthase enzyme